MVCCMYCLLFDDDLECPMDYDTSLLPKVFPLLYLLIQGNLHNVIMVISDLILFNNSFTC